MQEKINKRTSAERHFAVSTAIGIGSSLLTVFLLLLIFAAFTTAGIIPETMMKVITVSCCFVASFIGARVAVHGATEKKFLIGVSSGVLMFIFVFAAGRAISADATLNSLTFALLISTLIGGAIGGYLRTGRKRSKRK